MAELTFDDIQLLRQAVVQRAETIALRKREVEVLRQALWTRMDVNGQGRPPREPSSSPDVMPAPAPRDG